MKKIAVITGASSGIGREFACLLDDMGKVDEIWLVARRRERLTRLAADLRTACRVLPLDLTKAESFVYYHEQLAGSGARVSFLINCAGLGKFGSFASNRQEDIDDMIRLNVTAVVMMCKYTLPFMARGGHIINMASSSAWLPLPYFSIYAATKAFVRHFSLALGEELASSGVGVTAVSPLWMNTEFIDIARDSPEGDAVDRFLILYEPRQTAVLALTDALSGKAESVTRAQKLIRRAVSLLPENTSMLLWNKIRKKRNALPSLFLHPLPPAGQ